VTWCDAGNGVAWCREERACRIKTMFESIMGGVVCDAV
jgi:hypothetical protein